MEMGSMSGLYIHFSDGMFGLNVHFSDNMSGLYVHFSDSISDLHMQFDGQDHICRREPRFVKRVHNLRLFSRDLSRL